VSQALSGTLHLKSALHGAIDVLSRHHGGAAIAVFLRERDSGPLVLAAATRHPAAALPPLPGADAVTERVVDSGRHVVLPSLDDEPLLARPKRHPRGAPCRTLIVLPVLLQDTPVGALRVELPFKADRTYERLVGFYRVAASMMSEALRLSRLGEAERRRLDAGDPVDDVEAAACRRMIGTSSAIHRVFEQVRQVARASTTVLIHGESGTGKELVAQAIHETSARARRPFVRVNLAALPDTLVESELFGYERGAFTGAQGLKKGRFELADGGTLFLDEVGDLTAATQVKLLRVLQEREFERLGGTHAIKVNVRIIAATHRSLERLVAAGSFRADLYYRLNVFAIVVPPLRDRRADIPLLADHFAERCAREHGRPVARLSPAAFDMLSAYEWPGNVRELENTIERAVLVSGGTTIHGYHLPSALQVSQPATPVYTDLCDAVAAFERNLITEALDAAHGNVERAARLLNTTARIIRYKMRRPGPDTTTPAASEA
jgi:Nif-specific regulatory protein